MPCREGPGGRRQCRSGGGEEQGASLSQSRRWGFHGKDKAGQWKLCGWLIRMVLVCLGHRGRPWNQAPW